MNYLSDSTISNGGGYLTLPLISATLSLPQFVSLLIGFGETTICLHLHFTHSFWQIS